MSSGNITKTAPCTSEMIFPLSFGEWLRSRRKALDLTQADLANRVSCTVFAIRKIEAGERRPSKQLAELLARSLGIPVEEQGTFIKAARGDLTIKRLPAPGLVSSANHHLDRGPGSSRGNLPLIMTAFIGREPELITLRQLLSDPQCRMLTLVGLGGIGKTRLAVEAGNRYKALFTDGVWFVSLAPLTSPELLIPAIANAVNFRFHDQSQPKVQLFNYLGDKKALLVLDNAEHLLDGFDVFEEILQNAPGVKLLVTSRERLNLLCEWVFEIQGLPVPARDQAEQLEIYSSVALFMESARRANPRFLLDATERAGVADICRLVEGMPLAIELAATWVRMLSTAEIAAEIKHSLDFLSNSPRDVPERHRSIRAVFDHSWQMLSTDEQQVLGQLSIFRGGFQRQAAEQVAGASLSILSTLVNRTLVRRSQAQFSGSTVRYDLHELIRQYSADQLLADPQASAAAQKRHYVFFLALAETANLELKGPNQLEWLNRLEQDLDNFRAAFEWALNDNAAAQGIDEPALRLAGALRWFWRMRGHFYEGCGWLTEALRRSMERPTMGRASALLGLSLILNGLGDMGAARPLSEESAAIYRELGDQRGLAEALVITGQTLVWQGEAALSRARLEEALSICRNAGDRWGEAQVLYRLGNLLADYSGDPMGQMMLAESAAILEGLGEKYLFVSVLISLGIAEKGFGDYAAARNHFERGLVVAREIGHPWGIADALTNLGCLFSIQGDYETAQRHFDLALRVYQEHGRSTWKIDVLCAQVENDIAQGYFSSAQQHLQAASSIYGLCENKWLQVLVVYFRGLLASYQGDVGGAVVLLEEAMMLARGGCYKPDLARALVTLGRVKHTLGEFRQATELTLEGLDLFHTLGHKLGIATAIESLATIRAAQGDGVQTALLFSAAHRLREKLGAPLAPVDRSANASAIADCRGQLGETAFKSAWEDAAARPFQEVVEGILENNGILLGFA